ncbi:hypothetical protein MMC21_001772 [Puttea exsequens]|nr:hypothetical protein [Puttea exsequens]
MRSAKSDNNSQAHRTKAVRWEGQFRSIDSAVVVSKTHQHQDGTFQNTTSSDKSGDTDEASAEHSIATIDEDSPWSKMSLLSLDGGGVRGLSTLLILKELMTLVGKHEQDLDENATSSAYSPLIDPSPDDLHPTGYSLKPSTQYLPCHYFDYIGGTSTGGLIAIMLGRLRMSVDEAIREYTQLSANVFQKPSSRLRRYLTKYNSAARTEHLQSSFKKLRPLQPSPLEEGTQFKSDPVRCRTVVCSIKSTPGNEFQIPFLFRSYDPDKTRLPSTTRLQENPLDRHAFAIWEVARATSAAPSFFKSVNLHDERYYDAGVDLSNPSWEILNEVSSIASNSHEAIDLLLSIGSGNASADKPKLKFHGGNLLPGSSHLSEAVHRKMSEVSERRLFHYYRLEVDERLQNVRPYEWKPTDSGTTTLQRVEDATAKYLKTDSVRSQCSRCARILVNRRVQRAQTMRWESFATGTRYRCPLADECPMHITTRFANRNDLMDHLRMQHNKAPPDTEHYQEIQMLLDAGRTNSE